MSNSADLQPATSKKTLRKTLRNKRRALSRKQQQRASKSLAHQLPTDWRWKGSTIAAYWADDGEIDPCVLIKALQCARKKIFLPFVDPNHRMRFVSFQYRDLKNKRSLTKGRWGIYHPRLSGRRFIHRLYLQRVFVPLVAFDIAGNRLGRGGGFYDKLLANTQRTSQSVGLAHHFQQVDHIPKDQWDIALDAVITDQSFVLTTAE